MLFEVNKELYYKILDFVPNYKTCYLKFTCTKNDGTYEKEYLISGNIRSFRNHFIEIYNNKNLIDFKTLEFIEFVISFQPDLFNDLSLISYSLDKEKDEDESQIALILDPERLSTYQKMIHCYMTVRFIHDRGFTHELVRMRRDCSYSQESTRYCNYSDGKGNDIKYIYPIHMFGIIPLEEQEFITKHLENTEEIYNDLINRFKIKPQYARNFLQIGLKTEIIMTANLYEWCHVFRMRSSINPRAHPEMHRLMDPLLEEAKGIYPCVFGGSLYDKSIKFD